MKRIQSRLCHSQAQTLWTTTGCSSVKYDHFSSTYRINYGKVPSKTASYSDRTSSFQVMGNCLIKRWISLLWFAITYIHTNLHWVWIVFVQFSWKQTDRKHIRGKTALKRHLLC